MITFDTDGGAMEPVAESWEDFVCAYLCGERSSGEYSSPQAMPIRLRGESSNSLEAASMAWLTTMAIQPGVIGSRYNQHRPHPRAPACRRLIGRDWGETRDRGQGGLW